MSSKRFLLVFALLLLTSCASRTAPPPEPAPGSASSSAREEFQPAYFGDWETLSSPGAAPGCALSQEELDALTGTALSYTGERFTTGGQSWSLSPGAAYAEGIVTAQDFETACQMPLSQLGIDAAMLLHVTVNLQGDEPLLGRDFFVLDSDRLLLYHDGAFFLAERAE